MRQSPEDLRRVLETCERVLERLDAAPEIHSGHPFRIELVQFREETLAALHEAEAAELNTTAAPR